MAYGGIWTYNKKVDKKKVLEVVHKRIGWFVVIPVLPC